MDTKSIIILVVILFLISIVIDFILSKLRNNRINQLMNYFMQGQIDLFDELLNRRSTKFFLPVYNSIVLRMNKAILTNDKKLLSDLIDAARKIKMTDEQKLYLYSKAFSYYISIGDNQNTKDCFEKIMDCKDSQGKDYVIMVFDTIIEGGYKYLKQAEEMLETATGEDKKNIYALIEIMKNNKRKVEAISNI